MRRRQAMKKLALFLAVFCLTLLVFRSVAAQSPTPTPSPNSSSTPVSEMTPDDPRYDDAWARIPNSHLPRTWKYETTATPKVPEVVVIIFGESLGDCDHPDLKANCLPQENFNATNGPDAPKNMHDLGVASIIGAAVNNHIGPASVAGLTGRVRFAFYQVAENGHFNIEFLQKGLRRILERKNQGLPVVGINMSFVTGDSDPTVTEPLLAQIRDAGILIVAAGPTAPEPIDMDSIDNMFPASYSRRYSNIITVTALRQDGQALTSVSPVGAKTIAFAAPGENVQVVGILDPLNSSASFSGTSPAAAHVTAVNALIRLHVETDWLKALDRQKATAKMIPALEGKVGNGIPDAYAALTAILGCPTPTPDVRWVTEPDSNRAVALNASTLTSGPFSITDNGNLLNKTGQARIMLLAYNAGTEISLVQVQAEDTTGHIVQLPVEYVGKSLGSLPCVSQINVKLVSDLAPGDIFLTITAQGQTSSARATIAIKP